MVPTLQRIARKLAPLLVGLTGAWAGMAIWGSTTVEMGPFEVRLDTGFGRGSTDIVLPPLGHLTADTHTAPLRIQATLLDVRVPELTRALRDADLSSLVERVETDAEVGLRVHALLIFGVAIASALGLSLLVFRLQRRAVGLAVLAAVVAVGGSELLALATYRADAFRTPTYSGSLALAERVIPPVRTAEQIDAFREQLARVVDGAIAAYTSIQTNPLGGDGEIRVLHISDLHLAPFGFEFARQIADGFDVDFVVDTGDTISFGTEPESLVLSEIRDFGRPYVWVRGNHDSTAFQAAVARLPNAIVLDGDATTLDGLRIYGLGHPVPPTITRDLPDEVFAERAFEAGKQILADLEGMPAVDIVAVHDDRMAEAVAGLVPLVISGHFHENGARVESGTLFLRLGTTGGSALATFEPEGGIPLSAEVLYFEPGSPPRLIAYDLIQQSPKTGALTVTRHLVENEFGALTPSPPPTPSPSPAPPQSSQSAAA